MADHTFTLSDSDEALFVAAGRDFDSVVADFITSATAEAQTVAVQQTSANLFKLDDKTRAPLLAQITTAVAAAQVQTEPPTPAPPSQVK